LLLGFLDGKIGLLLSFLEKKLKIGAFSVAEA
jgi:hypothetical protein